MLAVTVRAYPAAIILLDTIHRVVAKVVIPPIIICDVQGSSNPDQEHAIKNVMSAWRSSVAGTGSNPNSNKGTPELSNQPIGPLFKNTPVSNFELPHTWSLPTSGLPQQQSADFSKGMFLFLICGYAIFYFRYNLYYLIYILFFLRIFYYSTSSTTCFSL